MNIEETQQAYEEWLQANPDFDESLLEKSDEDDECSEYLDDGINSMYSAFDAGATAQEQISLNEIRAKQREIDELKAKLEKAQAMPEGFVVVPKESLKVALSWMNEDIDPWQMGGDSFAELYEHKPILEKVMIEAAQGEEE